MEILHHQSEREQLCCETFSENCKLINYISKECDEGDFNINIVGAVIETGIAVDRW